MIHVGECECQCAFLSKNSGSDGMSLWCSWFPYKEYKVGRLKRVMNVDG